MKIEPRKHTAPAFSLMFMAALAGLLAPADRTGALAASVTYSFSTAANPVGNGPIGGFAAGASVTGSFTYDAATPAFGGAADGSTVYRSTTGHAVVGTLSAAVNGVTITDPRGSAVSVGHNLAQVGSTLGPVDFLQLSFEPPLGTGTHDISAPTFGAYTLVNLRIFWIQGINGVPPFLPDQNLPAALPASSGRLALDFYPTGNLSGPLANSVFFDAVQIAAVPEPESSVLMLAGLAVCVQVARRRAARLA
jgi:hypothetical protein